MFGDHTFVSRVPGLQWRRDGPDGKHATVVLPVTGAVHMLNPAGARILDALDGSRSLSAVLDLLRQDYQDYDVAEEVLRRDLYAITSALVAAGVCRVEKE